MKFEWKIKKISDIAEINPRESLRKGTVAKKIPMEALQPFTKSISSYQLKPFKGGTKFRNKDTIMARITPCLENGKIAQVSCLKPDEVGFGSTEYIVFRAKDGTDPDYLYYLICCQLVREPAIKSMVGSSGRQRVQTDVVANLQIAVPEFDEQKKIGAVLKLLDDKIELNTEINKNLLQQATTLFSEYLHQSKNVFYVKLDTLADVKGGKRLPKGVNLITTPNSHPYIRVKDLNNVVFASLTAEYEYVDNETQKSIARYTTSTGDVLISIVGTIGLTAIVDKSLDCANLTENCVKVTNLSDKISPEYLLLYLRSPEGIEAIKKGTVGAVQLKLPIKNIQATLIPLLPKEEFNSLEIVLKSIFKEMSLNVMESKRLASVRDALLPKLISGKIDVSGIDL